MFQNLSRRFSLADLSRGSNSLNSISGSTLNIVWCRLLMANNKQYKTELMGTKNVSNLNLPKIFLHIVKK